MEDIVVYGGLWIVCGILTAVIATSKNRNGCAWFAVGFLLGPLGLIACGFMPKIDACNSSYINSDSSKDVFLFSNMQIVSFSYRPSNEFTQGSDGRWYNYNQICKVDGGVERLVLARQQYLKSQISSGEQHPDTETKICPFCAETIKRAAKVCRYCGRDLPVLNEEKQSGE